jgi:hypothetical protein
MASASAVAGVVYSRGGGVPSRGDRTGAASRWRLRRTRILSVVKAIVQVTSPESHKTCGLEKAHWLLDYRNIR